MSSLDTPNIHTSHSQSALSVISSLMILWLLIPYVIFALKLYEPYLAIPSISVVGYFSFPLLKSLRLHKNSIPFTYLLSAFLGALFFTWFSGLIPPLGMGIDWEKHFSIMKLLSSSDTWPPTILNGIDNYFLRYNIAIYIVPVLLENVIPIGIRYWMAFYEIIGLTLFFTCLTYLVIDNPKNKRFILGKSMLIIFIFIGFSGLDMIGNFYKGIKFNIDTGLEWWAWLSSFPSIKTQFDFMPQHCLPAWMATLILYLNHRHHQAVATESILLMLSLVFFWSPLVFLGLIMLLPLYMKTFLSYWKVPKNITTSVLLIVVIIIPLIAYFGAGANTIPKWIMFNPLEPTLSAIKEIAIFLILEVYLYTTLLFVFYKDQFHRKLIINMMFIFALCTIFHVGVAYNDFSLKVSMPALGLLAALVIKVFLEPSTLLTTQKTCRTLLLTIYLIGLFTPIYQLVKSYHTLHLDYSVVDAGTQKSFNWAFVQYFARVEDKPFFLKH